VFILYAKHISNLALIKISNNQKKHNPGVNMAKEHKRNLLLEESEHNAHQVCSYAPSILQQAAESK